ncbi:unnamed protein product, partial [Nesidiocoris tenuis]
MAYKQNAAYAGGRMPTAVRMKTQHEAGPADSFPSAAGGRIAYKRSARDASVCRAA